MSYSLIRSKTDTSPVWQDLTLGAMYDCVSNPAVYANKDDQPALIGCRYDGQGRRQKNVVAVTAVILDYDKEVAGYWEKAQQGLNDAGLEYVMYTSASHTKEKPRFRVVLSLSGAAKPFQLRYYVDYVSDLLDIDFDKCSFDVGHFFYYGKVSATKQDYTSCYEFGDFIDALADAAPTSPSLSVVPTIPVINNHQDAADRMLDALANPSPPREKWIRELGGFLRAGCRDDAIARWSSRSEQYPDDTDYCLSVLSTMHDREVTAHAVAMLADRYRNAIAQTIDDFQAIAKQHDRFTIHRASEYRKNFASASWIVEDFIPQAQVGMIYGASGSGKTFFILDLVADVAQGKPWRNLKTVATSVIYVASEASRGIKPRLEAYYQGHLDADLSNLKIVEDAPDLSNLLDVKLLIEKIQGAGPASLITIDTLSASHAGNENSSQDMGVVMKHCRMISDATGAMVLLVHHTGKEEAKGARGSSALFAACDVVLEITNVDGARSVRVDKQKDGEAIQPIGFSLEKILIGVDANGKQMSSCIVTECAVVLAPTKAQQATDKHNEKLRSSATGLPQTIIKALENLEDIILQDDSPSLEDAPRILFADLVKEVHVLEIEMAKSKGEVTTRNTETRPSRVLASITKNKKLFTYSEEKGIGFVCFAI